MFSHNDVNFCLPKCGPRHGLRRWVAAVCMLIAAKLLCGAMLAHAVDLADVPMFTQINPPPPNIMILMDDSGSMTYEVLVKGQYEGQFITAEDNFCYVFGNLGDRYYVPSDSCSKSDSEDRKYWKSQFHEENFLYYNPNISYEPWPAYPGQDFEDADKITPRVHPLKDITLDLDTTSFTVPDGDGIVINHAHYYVKSQEDSKVYLVEMDGVHKYYTFTVSGSGLDEKIDALTEVPPPTDLQKDYETDRQNFANWFTYHRRREFVAKAAIAEALRNLSGFRVGILSINKKIIVPLKPVKAVIGAVFVDETDTLIKELLSYESKPRGGTKLKAGLERVGEYYQANDGDLQGQSGDEPYPADGGACQQSFTIIVTDGYYSDKDHTFDGNIDGSNSDPYKEWGGGSQPYRDDYKNTLADMAMYFYATDLSTMDDKVPTNKWDRAAHQHMVTFAVAFGVSGTLDPDDYEDDRTSTNYMKDTNGNYVVWPDVPGDREPESIDDLWHATVNARGKFLNAGTPGQLGEALAEILRNIGARKGGSGASVAVNGDWLYTKINQDILVFQSFYSNEQDEWVGDVKAFGINPVSGKVDSENPKWSAAGKLQLKDGSSRNILTYKNDTDLGSAFDYDQLTGDQQKDLNEDRDVVDYIKGQEISGFRSRSQKLGDIVHSSPVFENNVVYVGANDGMLHAFDVTDGDELFAYVPNLVFGNLINLTDPAYTHKFFVDLTPTVKKGQKLLDDDEEQTILVGGLGKGGKGYFALDITNPKSMSAADVLWEFPKETTDQADKDDMGYSYSKPVVVQSNSTTTGESWIVIFGNGYNSASGKSVLYILDAAFGNIINKIVADDSGSGNGLSSPIAVDVNFDDKVDFVYAGDLKGNLWKFDLTRTSGSEWEVAYKDGAAGVPLFTAIDPDGDPQPITSKPDVMLHPEQHGLIVCFGTGKFLGISDFSVPQIQTIYGIWDYGDKVFQPQAGIGWSPDPDPDIEFLGTFRVLNEEAQLSNQPPTVKLLEQEASEVKVGSGEDEVIVRVLTDEQPVWATTPDPDGDDQLPDPSNLAPNDAGWYLDLGVYTGERVVSDVILRNGILIVIGFIPEDDRCGSGGDSVFMELNAFTGGQLAGINFDIHDDGSIGQDDYVQIEKDGETINVPPSGIKLAGNIQPPAIIQLNETTEKKYLSSSSGGIVEITERAAKTGIAYWMEIRQ